jgi:hypothetical protein
VANVVHIAILDIALGSVDGAGDGVLTAHRLALDPAGEAGGAKVMTTWQHARQADGFIKRVVADATLEERGDVGGEGRGGKGRALPLRMRSRHVCAIFFVFRSMSVPAVAGVR